MAKKVFTHNLYEPLNGVTTVKVDIDAGDGNLSVDGLAAGEPALATGTLQVLESEGQPTRALIARDVPATFTLRREKRQGRFVRLPWAACNGATEWQIHLNPTAALDITAHSDGGNVKLDLEGMAVTHVSADTGGGNVDVRLPDPGADLSVTAKSGAGNVTVLVPSGVVARIHARTGLGKTIVDPRFTKTGDNTYESPNFGSATRTIEVTAQSGAGNVVVATR